MVRDMAERFGRPAQTLFEVEVGSDEFDFIRSTQRNDRAHDATLYMLKEGHIVANAKHFYPPGMYRAPSGGLNPGESFDDAIARELWEETGLRADLEHFVLISHVRFIRGETGRLLSTTDIDGPGCKGRSGSGVSSPGRANEETRHRPRTNDLGVSGFSLRSEPDLQADNIIAWTSYVFQLSCTDGDFEFTDHREIREVTTAPLSSFAQFGEMMRSSDKGGLHYRAALHERVEPLLRL